MSIRIAYGRVVGLIAKGLFKIPSKSVVWLELLELLELLEVFELVLKTR